MPDDVRVATATVADVVGATARRLGAAGVAEPTAEARELVAALLDVPRFWPAMNAGAPAEPELLRRAIGAAEKRAMGAPLAYAVGRASFRHLTLDVDERVLIPRPETEQLVDLVLELEDGTGGIAVDVGTGSGAIALALASEGRYERVVAVDLSQDAIAVASHNAALLSHALRCPVEFRHGSLLGPVAELRPRVIVSNPPYIAFAEAAALPASVRDWEPSVALFSADQGLADTRRLVRQAGDLLLDGGLLALEVDARRASLVAELVSADRRFREVAVRLDLSGRERFVTARR